MKNTEYGENSYKKFLPSLKYTYSDKSHTKISESGMIPYDIMNIRHQSQEKSANSLSRKKKSIVQQRKTNLDKVFLISK